MCHKSPNDLGELDNMALRAKKLFDGKGFEVLADKGYYKAEDLKRCVLGERIRQERSKKGLTQEKLAEMCELSDSYIGIIERAEKNMTVGTLVKIALVLNVSIEGLLIDSIRPQPKSSDLLSLISRLSPDEADMALDILNAAVSHYRRKT